MMWDRLSDLASTTLSTHPTKQEIKNLRKLCLNTFDETLTIDRNMEAELWRTVDELGTLLERWDEDGQDTARLLRFYSNTSSKTARFNRYAI